MTKLKIKKSNLEEGFTLVELLAVMVVMVAVGIIVSSILVSSLRGTNKTSVINDIRQSGSYPVAQISKMIEFSKSFEGVSLSPLPENYTTNCVPAADPPPPEPTPTPTQYKYIKIALFDDSEVIFSCEGDPLSIASNGASLIDVDYVNVDSCYFTCSQNYITQPPVIGIHFLLSKKASTNFSEQSVSIPFDTTVTVRNFGN